MRSTKKQIFYPSEFTDYHSKKDLLKKNSSWRELFSLKQVWETVDEYCRQSTLHGLKYTREPCIPRIDRLLWLAIFVASVYFCAAVISEIYKSGPTEQFEMTFNPVSTPIWEIPFPAVMICSMYPVRKSVFDLEKNVNNTKFRFYSKLVCPAKEGFEGETFNTVINEDLFDFISKVAIPCEDLLIKCTWSGIEKDCCTLFKPIITSHGQCYMFNSLPGQLLHTDHRFSMFSLCLEKVRLHTKFDPAVALSSPPPRSEDVFDDRLLFWDSENGYPSRNGERWKSVYPYWSEYAGEHSGLTVDLACNRDQWQDQCSGGQSGYELKIFSPIDGPEGTTGLKIANRMHTNVALTPVSIHAEKSLAVLIKEARGCLFQHENYLKYFKIYSQTSCHIECMMKRMLEQCDCVPFHANRFLGLRNYIYCTEETDNCRSQVLAKLIVLAMQPDNLSDSCTSCFPACSYLMYDYQSNAQPIVTPQSLPPWAEVYNATMEPNIARVSVYFSVQQFTALTRRMTGTFSDFLGNCGGLLGLFLGFSFMSVFEIFYFAVIRPTTKLLIYLKNYKRK